MQVPALFISALKRLNSRHGEGIIVGVLIGPEVQKTDDGAAWPVTITVQNSDGERLERCAWVYPERRLITYYGRASPY